MSTAREPAPARLPERTDPAEHEAPLLDAYLRSSRRAGAAALGDFDSPDREPFVAEANGRAALPGQGTAPEDDRAALERAQELAARTWGARRTFFLTGGAAQGLQAACLSLAQDGVAVVQGNASVGTVQGLVVSGLQPTLVEPEADRDLDVAHCVTPAELERALEAAPEAAAAFVASPTFLGVIGDVAGLAEVARARGVALVVDETWGAHLAFHPELPDDALAAGADLVVSGTHETFGGLTQSAMLHLGADSGERVEEERLARALAIAGPAEPSALLLASLDDARRTAATRGGAWIEDAIAFAGAVRESVARIDGVEVIGERLLGRPGVAALDPARVVLDVSAAGASGHHVREALDRAGAVRADVATPDFVALPTGLAGEPLTDAELVAEAVARAIGESLDRGARRRRFARPAARGRLAMTPRAACLAPQETVELEAAVGRVAAEPLSVHPAAAATLLPGERVSDATRAFVERTVKQGAPAQGSTDPSGATLRVVASSHDPGDAGRAEADRGVAGDPPTTATATAAAEPAHAPFEDFPARAYLEKYYSGVGPENAALLGTLIDYVATTQPPSGRVIEVAGGPSLFSMLTLAAVRGEPFEEVLFTDLGRENLAEVERWLAEHPERFDYAHLLEWLEHRTGASPERICATARASDWQLAGFDWKRDPPPEWCGRFDVVSSHFFAESATANEDEFVAMMRRIPRLGRPGALVLMSFMSRSQGYTISGADYPGFDVDETTLLAYFREAGVSLDDLFLRTVAAEDPASDPGYEGLLFVAGRLARTEPGS